VLSQNIVRSTSSGAPDSDVTTVDTGPRFSIPGTVFSGIVTRDFGGRICSGIDTLSPLLFRNLTSASTSVLFGLAINTSVVKNEPVDPSGSR
jgi:hypothetical protein